MLATIGMLKNDVLKKLCYLSLVGTPALQTAAMLDCLVTIKATMNVLQKCKDKIADSLNKVDKTTSLLQRFARVVVDVLKNGKVESFLRIVIAGGGGGRGYRRFGTL